MTPIARNRASLLLGAIPLSVFLLMLSATPVVASGTTLYVSPTGVVSNTDTSCATAAYSSVQTAVTAATAGATVQVCAGNYAENVTVNKNITLLGAQAGIDARTRSGAESIVQSVSISTSNVTVDGFSFNGTGSQLSVSSPTTLSGLVVQNDIFKGYSSVGLPTYDAGNIMIQKNLFENALASSEAMQIKADTVAGGCNGSQVLDNTFAAATNNGGADVNFTCTNSNSSGVTVSGNVTSGISGGSSFVAFSGVDSGISVTNNAGTTDGSTVFFFGNVSGTALITGNRFSGGGGSAVSIHGGEYTSDVPNTGTFTITNNSFTGNIRGVYISSVGLGAGGNVLARYNDLTGNSTAGVDNESVASTIVQATDNWWGCAGGPGNAGCAAVIHAGPVNFTPWLASLTLTPSSQTVQTSSSATVHATLLDNSGAVVSAVPLRVTFTTSPGLGTGNVPLSAGTASFSFTSNSAQTVTVHATLTFAVPPVLSTLTSAGVLAIFTAPAVVPVPATGAVYGGTPLSPLPLALVVAGGCMVVWSRRRPSRCRAIPANER